MAHGLVTRVANIYWALVQLPLCTSQVGVRTGEYQSKLINIRPYLAFIREIPLQPAAGAEFFKIGVFPRKTSTFLRVVLPL